jgi:hypothetical protein
MEKELQFTKSQLGMFDTALLMPYALVQVKRDFFPQFPHFCRINI